MKHLTTLIAGLAAVALTAGAAAAQTPPNSDAMGKAPAPSGSMSSDSMQSGAMNKGAMSSGSMTMSKSHMSTMKSCQAMSHDAMMASSKCKSFMAAHPDMFNADGTMKPQ